MDSALSRTDPCERFGLTPHPTFAFRYDRYAFNTGFQSSSISIGDLALTLLFELAVELVVDFLAVNTELKKKGLPIHLYYKLLTRETALGQIVSCGGERRGRR